MNYSNLVKEALENAYLGEYKKAIELYEEAFNEHIELNDYANYAICLQADRNYEKAETVLFEILEYSETSFVYQTIAINYSLMGQYVESIDYFKKAIELDPQNTDARLSLSGIYEEFKEEELAKAEYEKILEYEPDNFWALVNLGSYYEVNNDLDTSIKYLSKAILIEPNEKMINYNLGVYYVRQKEYDKAKYHYLEEIKHPECYAYAYLNLALLYKDAYHDNANSKQTYLEGIDRFPDVSELWYNLGCLYVEENQYDLATNYISKSFSLDNTLIDFSKTDKELIEYRKDCRYQQLIEKYS